MFDAQLWQWSCLHRGRPLASARGGGNAVMGGWEWNGGGFELLSPTATPTIPLNLTALLYTLDQ